jgi:hypothetical protein
MATSPARKTAPAAKKTRAVSRAATPAARPLKGSAAPVKKAAKPGGAAKPAARAGVQAAAKKDGAKLKVKKLKMVRDSFTMPEPEYKVLGEVKRTCLKAGVEVKKSELLRVGVAQLQKLQLDQLKAALAMLLPVKAGRPKAAK